MPSPFPGMDPYLEHPAWWGGVHQRLITHLACFAIVALAGLHRLAGLDPATLRLHKEDPKTTHKFCPGKNISKADFQKWIADEVLGLKVMAGERIDGTHATHTFDIDGQNVEVAIERVV